MVLTVEQSYDTQQLQDRFSVTVLPLRTSLRIYLSSLLAIVGSAGEMA